MVLSAKVQNYLAVLARFCAAIRFMEDPSVRGLTHRRQQSTVHWLGNSCSSFLSPCTESGVISSSSQCSTSLSPRTRKVSKLNRS